MLDYKLIAISACSQVRVFVATWVQYVSDNRPYMRLWWRFCKTRRSHAFPSAAARLRCQPLLSLTSTVFGNYTAKSKMNRTNSTFSVIALRQFQWRREVAADNTVWMKRLCSKSFIDIYLLVIVTVVPFRGSFRWILQSYEWLWNAHIFQSSKCIRVRTSHKILIFANILGDSKRQASQCLSNSTTIRDNCVFSGILCKA